MKLGIGGIIGSIIGMIIFKGNYIGLLIGFAIGSSFDKVNKSLEKKRFRGATPKQPGLHSKKRGYIKSENNGLH